MRYTDKLPTNDKGNPVDPFTGEPLVPVKELQEAARQIPTLLQEVAPSLPEGYWTSIEFGKAIQRAKPKIEDAQAAGKRIISALREKHKTTEIATYRDIQVSKDAIKAYYNNGNLAYAIRQQEGQKIADALALEREKPAGYP